MITKTQRITAEEKDKSNNEIKWMGNWKYIIQM